jgi:predicted DsbA family dithiol-disulfide isomerase|tara:strand:+ start:834 stop:1451 length:618 start_codon:yes stop_codon:yes gene_type:complete
MKIQIFIDTICGWCFVGSQRLLSTLKKIDKKFEIIYVPFQLNPEIPMEGMDRSDYVINKFGSIENASPMYSNMIQEAKKETIDIKLEKIQKTPNTILSHVLIDLARRNNAQTEIVFEIFLEYFTKGTDIGEKNNLIKIGTNHGIKEDLLVNELDSKKNREKINKMDKIGRQIGITGVPFYVFNEKIFISGAQSVKALEEAIEKAE